LKRLCILSAVTVAALLLVPSDRAHAESLCTKSETAFFSCQTASKKWIALCGKSPKEIQYRFGGENHVELAYPTKTVDSNKQFRFAHYFRSQTDRTEVTFSNGKTSYAVFDYTEEKTQRSGVRVTLADGKEREIACAGKISSELQKLEKALPCDADNARQQILNKADQAAKNNHALTSEKITPTVSHVLLAG